MGPYLGFYPQPDFFYLWSPNLFLQSSILSCPLILITKLWIITQYLFYDGYGWIYPGLFSTLADSFTSADCFTPADRRSIYYQGLGRLCSLPTHTFNISCRGNWLSTKIYASDFGVIIFCRKLCYFYPIIPAYLYPATKLRLHRPRTY